MKKISTPQLTKIHVLLSQFNLMEAKQDLVFEFSNGRETSSKNLTFEEARALLSALSKMDVLDKMRRKIFALAYDAKIIWGSSKEDRQINLAKLNMFLNEKGTVKKDINKMNKEELSKTISQFVQIVKHNQENAVRKSVRNILSETGISTSRTGAVNPINTSFKKP